eukprot:snap_masked-scaffold_1-processed-gene-14.16-mRNA-1 protein AED:0.01 eAED:0.01 QI:0/0/0/0.5/1/1/2/0/490
MKLFLPSLSFLSLTSAAFPAGFEFGVSTSAYQIEGGWDADGKGPSIWDIFSHVPGNMFNDDNGDVACDHYNRYEEDVQLLVDLGVTSYRFSMSWPRIIPTGFAGSEVNQGGIDFYNSLIDLLLENNIKPMVTLYHWDLPSALYNETGGMLNRTFIDHFQYYAEVVFENFGDRVKSWITFNEPYIHSWISYEVGVHAPGHTSFVDNIIVGHHQMLAHGYVYEMFHERFNANGDGKVGITLDSGYSILLDDLEETAEAGQLGMDARLGRFADVIWGEVNDYPPSQKAIYDATEGLGELVAYSDEEKALLKDASDFFGLNHYRSSFYKDGVQDNEAGFEAGLVEGYSAVDWEVTPFGFGHLLRYIQETYSPRGGIYVTENGVGYTELEDNVDELRIAFYDMYIGNMSEAIDDGVDVRGYFAWSFLDNLEWNSGFNIRFGITFMDYDTLEREPKPVSFWYRDFIASNLVSASEEDDDDLGPLPAHSLNRKIIYF